MNQEKEEKKTKSEVARRAIRALGSERVCHIQQVIMFHPQDNENTPIDDENTPSQRNDNSPILDFFQRSNSKNEQLFNQN